MLFKPNFINKNFYSALALLLSSNSLIPSFTSLQGNQINIQNKQFKTVQTTPIKKKNTVASKAINLSKNIVLPATINLIKEHEGFRSNAYIDTSGLPVIGYGQTRINGRTVTMGQYITQAQAEAALATEIQYIQGLVLANVKVELTPHQLGALTSLVYNAGARVVTQSTLIKKLNSGDYQGAAQEFTRWNKAHLGGRLVALPGLTKRRIAEKNLFLTPYSAISSNQKS
jgi:lysozyme